jgi:hypothetical protein
MNTGNLFNLTNDMVNLLAIIWILGGTVWAARKI